MTPEEANECMKYMDVVEVLIKKELPIMMAEKGEIEDAVAYAMAEGFRMGWEAHKKKCMENN